MKKILIVEDDPIVARIYRGLLEKEGFEVHVAPDGHQGIGKTCELAPDAILLDLMLPKLNGLEVLKELRQIPQFELTPVYVLTNAFVDSMTRAATLAGATAVFNKASTTPRQIVDMLLAVYADAA